MLCAEARKHSFAVFDPFAANSNCAHHNDRFLGMENLPKQTACNEVAF
jgi:hypothetical protein